MLLVEDEEGDEAKYHEERGGYFAELDCSQNRARDDFYLSIIPQCSTYCHSEMSGDKSIQLLLVIDN